MLFKDASDLNDNGGSSSEVVAKSSSRFPYDIPEIEEEAGAPLSFMTLTLRDNFPP